MSKNNLGADYNDDTLKMGQQRSSDQTDIKFSLKARTSKPNLQNRDLGQKAIEKMDLFLAEKYPSTNVKKSLEARYYDRPRSNLSISPSFARTVHERQR